MLVLAVFMFVFAVLLWIVDQCIVDASIDLTGMARPSHPNQIGQS